MNPSISKADRVTVCPASHVFPQVETPNDAAERGTICHKFIEDSQIIGRATALEMVSSEHQHWCSLIDLEKLFADYSPKNRQFEQPFALDVESRTWRTIEKAGHRNYGESSRYEWVGTCDLVSELSDGTPVVVDWKTGSRLDDPEDKLQLKFHATVVHLMTGKPVVKARYVYIAGDGSFNHDEVTFSMLDFDECFDTLKSTTDRIEQVREVVSQGRVPDVVTGDHCKWCPAWSFCPAKQNPLKMLVPGLDALANNFESLRPLEVGVAYGQYAQLKELLDRLKPLFDEYLYERDIPLPDGKYATTVQSTRSSLNNTKLIQLSKKLGATDADLKSCYYSNSYYSTRVKNLK